RQSEDKKTIRKINELLKDIERNGNTGLGKPEPLSGSLAGYWSRRINEKDRLVYGISGNEIRILSCRFHYSDK
ncbi:MAG: Txe/YoeB family addiction module toxin, partial [Bullifex sp.]